MRAVVQRVTESSVTVENKVVGKIGSGLTVLLGVEDSDTEEDARWMTQKIPELRIFNDEEGKFNLSLNDVNGSILLVSQFTLHGDCRKGRRPSFIKAARPEVAIPLYEKTISLFKEMNIPTESGEFGAHMDVKIQNDGPVTLLLDSRKQF
jgi:D-tyrosyl-tRNA(Tyr) deacylase